MSLELVRKLPFNHPYRYDGSKFGGPTLWTPALITTEGWWDAYDEDQITTVTGVSNWADKSGNGYDWTQAGTSAQPAYGSRTLNGLKVLDFNGSTHGMVGSGYNLSGGNSMVFMVADMDAVTDWTGPIAQDSGETIRYGLYNESGAVSQARYRQSGIATRSMSTGINLISGYNNGSNLYAGINGEYTVGAAPATFSTFYRYLGFALDGFGGTTDFLDAGVGEIIMVDSYNETTRQTIEGYLAHKWGCEANLPSDHPYRWAPPIVAGTGAAITNLTAPVISGTAEYGETLTSTKGEWGGLPTSYTYQWKADGVNIAGATSSTYVLTLDEGGKDVTCEVTATNETGSLAQASNALSVQAPFVFTVKSDNTGTSANDQFTIPLVAGSSYNFKAHYDGTVTAHATTTDLTLTFPSGVGTYQIVITGVFGRIYFNNGGDKDKLVSVTQYGDVTWSDIWTNAFYGCSNVTDLGTGFPTNVTNMESTFNRCTSATSFPSLADCTSLNTLKNTWYLCSSVVTLPTLPTSAPVSNMESTYFGCSSATSFPSLSGFTLVNTLLATWRGCTSATSFPAVSHLTSITTIREAWYGCTGATSFPAVSALTNNISIHQTWYGCTGAATFPSIAGMSSLIGMYQAWRGCTGMTTVPSLPTSSTTITDCRDIMRDIGSGVTGTVEDLWNAAEFPNISLFSNAFTGCTGLDNYASIPNNWKGL